MPADLGSVLRFVFDDDGDGEPLYEECRKKLHAYIEAELDGEDAAELYPQVKRCLDTYAGFAEEYEEFRTLFLMERRGEFVEPPFEPTFDFSFLESPAPARVTGRALATPGYSRC